MSLNLPANFKNDIQGRDTALVPVIIIGTWGTDDWTYTEQWGDIPLIGVSTNVNPFQTGEPILPLLLNVPSLKESIDIEKRNYKISSINIDISNFPYNGERFSEIISDKSLINTECRVFWTSPSTFGYSIADIFPSGDTSAFQVYFGTIRRYTHDDEKVRLVVEDRSQATLHKDLPLEKHYLTGDEVPDKYKNKPIPMVYGHVDRSPCVVGEQSILGEIKIFPDTMVSSTTLNATYDNDGTLTNNPLIIFRDDKYYEVLSNDTSAGDSIISHWGYSNTEQYSIISNNNILISNLLSKDADNPGEGEPTFEILSPLSEDFAAVKITDFYENIKLYTSNDNIAQANGTYFYTASTIGEETLIYMTGDCGCIDDDYYDYKIQYLFPQLDKVASNNYTDEIESYISYKINFNYKTTWVVNNDGRELRLAVIGFGTGNTPFLEGYLYSHYDDVDISNEEKTYTATWVSDNEENSHYKLASQTLLLNAPFNTADSYNGSFSINSYERIAYILIDKFAGSDFYANVNGRDIHGVNDNAANQIFDIVKNELGHNGTMSDTAAFDLVPELNIASQHIHTAFFEAGGGYKTDFTVAKKINSKKLIEGLASVTPLIPRFDNMGNFRLDLIPMDGGTAPEGNRIKEADVIDFSFSRTKIEDVYTKIVFKYNWDYAREEFNDSVEADTDFIEGYSLDYYGLKDDHSESTLIIDDSRGKYIRDHDTAQAFAEWYLMWSCNQHLKMKIKLPLKYMFLEIGDLVDFDAILGGVEPYGIGNKDAINVFYVDNVNSQAVYKNFLITSTNKTLEWVEIECIQMHNLDPTEIAIQGCTNSDACNYNADANTNDGSCDYGTQYYQDLDGDGLGNGNVQQLICPGEDTTGWTTNCCDADDNCDCPANNSTCYDCFGECNGSAVIDDCGVCDGIADYVAGTCYDCADTPNGDAVVDDCGVCDGDNECVGCMDETANNTDDSATVPCDDCCTYGYCIPYLSVIFLDSNEFPTINLQNSNSMVICNLPFPESGEIYMINLDTYTLGTEFTTDSPVLIRFKTRASESFGYESRKVSEVLLEVKSADESIEILKVSEAANEITHLPDYTKVKFYNHDEGDIFKIKPENGVIEQRAYLVNFVFTITTTDGDDGTEITYDETLPVTFNYQNCVSLGDLNGDGGWNVLDIVRLANIVIDGECTPLTGEPAEDCCAGDMNNDGGWNVLDIVTLANCVLAGECGG